MKRAAFLAGAAVLPATALAQTARPQRIVSLAPSLTEMLFAIGAGPEVVGVSAFTNFPPQAAQRPVVATFATVDAERIVAMHADLVVGIAAQDALVRDLRRAGLRVRLLPSDSYDDIFTSISELGRLTGRSAAARDLNAQLATKTRALLASVVKRPKAPRIFIVLGVSPIYTVGDASYIAHLIRLAGGANAATSLAAPYGQFSEEALLALQPDAIVADDLSGVASVLDRPPWSSLRAVRAGRAHILTKTQADVLERPGPRYNEGLKQLIDIVASTPAV